MILSMFKIIIATLLSILIAFSSMGARAETPGVPAWDKDVYAAYVGNRSRLLRILTLGLAPPPRCEITFDETLAQAFAMLEANSGFDVEGTANSLPDIFYYHRWLVKLLPDFFYNLRDNWMAKGDAWQEAGDGSLMVLYRLLGVSAAMPVQVHIAAERSESDPDEYAVIIYLTYADGSLRFFNTFSTYNTSTGEFGENNGIGGLGYNFNIKKSWAYTTGDPFQRKLGYIKFYDDMLLQTSDMVNVDTVRLKFPWRGKDWMLQLWKGRYFTTTGGEVGLYNKPQSRLVEFYDAAADDERIGMSFKITAHDESGDIVLIDRPVQNHWWMTGFAVREYLYTPERITLETEIVPADEEMKLGLIAALNREAAKGVLTYTEQESDASLMVRW